MILKFLAGWGGEGDEKGYRVIIDTDGPLLVIGDTTSDSLGEEDIWTGRLNATGVWQKIIRFGGSNTDIGRAIDIGGQERR